MSARGKWVLQERSQHLLESLSPGCSAETFARHASGLKDAVR